MNSKKSVVGSRLFYEDDGEDIEEVEAPSAHHRSSAQERKRDSHRERTSIPTGSPNEENEDEYERKKEMKKNQSKRRSDGGGHHHHHRHHRSSKSSNTEDQEKDGEFDNPHPSGSPKQDNDYKSQAIHAKQSKVDDHLFYRDDGEEQKEEEKAP